MLSVELEKKHEHYLSAINYCKRALEWADKTTNIWMKFLRDYIRAYWLLGAAYRTNSDLTSAEENLSKAISMCRQINMVDHEANILLDLARLRYDQKNYEEAKNLAEEALLITERCGYVLQGADVNLFLAELTLTLDPSPLGRGKAREYAETALKLATCDGLPYYYKVAYEEAERLLKQLA
ncbi:MAG: tetratricopeptide repeat protein [Anaerolineae bacterium]|nr:tetratricopeptide repeat protein [Anaerolineae bacterium]MCI0608902.1 tetratricopeptide repeat protein [Anaerolineae bacterium]